MNKEEELTFGGRSLVDEVNHVYPCLVVYMCFDVCYFFYVVGCFGQSLYLL